MRNRHETQAERPELERLASGDHVQRDACGIALLLQLAADEPGGERRGIQRHTQILGQIGQRADMILMSMGEHDAEQIVDPVLDEAQVRQDDIDPRIGRIGKGDAAIDHDPFALAAIEIDVHANLARATKRKENQLVTRGHYQGFSIL